MPKYLFTYHGDGMPDDPDEQAAVMAAWGDWMGANAAAFVDMGAPVGAAKTVGADRVTEGGGGNPATGYSVVDAADIDAATAIAKGCPVVTLGSGTVEVGETVEVSM
jgi:hypothetical protein